MALNRARGGEDSLRSCVHAAGFGERFVRLIKANVNEALNKAEDPEKMLNQIVEDMQVRNRPTCPRCSHAATLPPSLCCAAADRGYPHAAPGGLSRYVAAAGVRTPCALMV